jgi:hypothetical protein
MNLDRHRDSLVKYCYDVSKVSFGIAVLNPTVTKGPTFLEFVVGFWTTLVFLGLAVLLEKDIKT